MKLEAIGNKKFEAHLPGGTVVLFSYSTPVAARLPDGSLVRTSTRYSATTTRHINQWLEGRTAREVSQDAINCLFAGS